MSKIINEALALMKEKGYKNTPKRREILEIMAQANKFVTAKYVYDKLVLKHETTKLSYETVYRNLYSFVEHGILEMSDYNGEKVFLLHCQSHSHHHHFICENCGQITELLNCPIDVFTQQLSGYSISNHRFEVIGLCPTCLNKEKVTSKQKHNHCQCGNH